jgi:hypothetical protein
MNNAAPKQGGGPSEEFLKYNKINYKLGNVNLLFSLIKLYMASMLW